MCTSDVRDLSCEAMAVDFGGVDGNGSDVFRIDSSDAFFVCGFG